MWLLIGFAIFAGIVVTLIVWGVIHGGKDNGLIPGLRKWQPGRLPATIVIDEDASEPWLEEAVAWARDFWNLAIGQIFVGTNEVGTGDVIPIMPSEKLANWMADHDDAVGVTRLTWDKDGAIMSASVYVDLDTARNLSTRKLRRALAHELGHVLGLDHDDARQSVMFGTVSDENFVVTAADRALLKGIYDGSLG